MIDGPETIDVRESVKPEQISSVDVVPPGSVQPIDVEGWKIIAAISISGASLVLGFVSLIIAVWIDDNELKTWATGLISLVVGTAIGFAFSTTKE
jgi:hypothetical protein